jgi:hypothetical protein
LRVGNILDGTSSAQRYMWGSIPVSSQVPFTPNVVPPSPEAAALAAYADIPVSLYTGIPQIAIPFYQLRERDLNVPIVLSYHASAHKVEDQASRVGLGWSVNAGGTITRSIRGLPDEYRRGGRGGFLQQAAELGQVDAYELRSDEQRSIWYDDMARGCRSAEPNIYYFNFRGWGNPLTSEAAALSCGFVPGGVREVQPLDSGEAGELGPAVVGAGGEQRSVTHEALHLDGVHAGVKEVGGEGPPSIVGAEVADTGLAGPAVDEVIDGLGAQAADGDSAGLVRGQVLMSFLVRAHVSVAGQARSLEGTTSI